MKKSLFNTVTWLTYAAIWCTDRAFGVPAASLMFVQSFVRRWIATAGYVFMSRLDPVRCKAAEAEADTDPNELERQGMELKLIQSAYQVRDHAKESGDWTDQHTEAIEAIGNALLLDMGWDEESVQEHLRSVVESIDGLTMDGWFEED